MKKLYIVVIILIIFLIYNVQNNKGADIMSNSKKVEELWRRMFSYWENIESKPYCKGASKKEIENFKSSLKLQLPNSFIKSLEVCNGEKIDKVYEEKYYDTIKANPLQDITLGIIELFDIDKILEYRYVGEDTPSEWIPLAYWYGIYSVALDTRKDTFGQILLAVVEDDTYKVWSNSYEEWLEIVVNEVIKYGKVREELLEQVYHDKSLKSYHYPNYN